MSFYSQIYRLSAWVISLLYRVATFFGLIFLFVLIYRALLDQFFDGSKQIYPLLALWLFSAYIVLPRIHRTLTKYYLPSYYVGRIRSPSGFLSDPINLVFFGSSKDVHRSMKKAGWHKADSLSIKSLIKTVYSVLFKKSYPTAPVGNMYLFSRVQDFAYQIEVNGSPAERHHIRFWKTTKNWRLPGGHKAEWLAAATYDTRVGLKITTGQIDHLIHENIDEERDFTIQTLKEADLIDKLEIVEHFSDAYHDRNNGGDLINTDGALPFIYLKQDKS